MYFIYIQHILKAESATPFTISWAYPEDHLLVCIPLISVIALALFLKDLKKGSKSISEGQM